MNAVSGLPVLLTVHAAATLFMTGLIWFVQVVHYPLFAGVGRDHAIAYQHEHERRTTAVVAVPMLAEAATAIALVAVVGGPLAWSGFVLLGVVWASTAFLQVPAHGRLGRGFDDAAHRRLVRTNWIRTTAWSVRAVLALVLACAA